MFFDEIDWKSKHSSLFSGMGSMSKKYKIELENGAQSFAITTSRKTSVPL